jgi:hypothetical protein
MKALGLLSLVVAGSLAFGFGCAVEASDFSGSTLVAQAEASKAAGAGEVSTEAPHLATPAPREEEGEKFSGFRQFLEDQQNAHDKLIVDRFLLGVAVIFACIAAALLFSLPPKPREQKE